MPRRRAVQWMPKAASGADDEDYSAFDTLLASRWVKWRAEFPVRGSGGVRITNRNRPSKEEQRLWHLYTNLNQEGRTHQEWWMPPFLVPIAEVAAVQWETPGTTEKAVLLQFSDDPGSGGPKTQQHYTNIHRIECLARTHPKVVMVGWHKVGKSKDPPTIFNRFGRAMHYHQSPHDLRLSLGSAVDMYVGCTVNETRHEALSLWWGPAKSYKLTPVQESLARAVFLDLAEARHDVPSMYEADFRAASGASAAAPSTSQAPRTTTLPLARPGAADYYAARPRKRRCLASYYGQ